MPHMNAKAHLQHRIQQLKTSASQLKMDNHFALNGLKPYRLVVKKQLNQGLLI